MTKSYFEEIALPVGHQYVKMVVRIWEPEAPKQTVFCIHGFTGNGGDFAPLAQLLASNGMRVVAPDMPGRGRSGAVSNPALYTIRTYLRCLEELSRFRSGRNAFVGTSWGGAISLAFLAVSGVPMDRIVLNDVVLKSDAVLKDTQQELRQEAAVTFATMDQAADYVKTSRTYLGTVPDHVWPTYIEDKIWEENGKFRIAWDPALVANFESEPPFDLSPLLEEILIPTLLLYGQQSRYGKQTNLEGLESRNRNIRLLRNLEGGHPPSLMSDEQRYLLFGFLSDQG